MSRSVISFATSSAAMIVLLAVASIVIASPRLQRRNDPDANILDIVPGDMFINRKNNECQSSADCGEGHCCVMGMQRYSVPSCQRLGSKGDQCRPYSEPENVTLYFPDYSQGTPSGVEIDFSDVFRIFCPCDVTKGLSCSRREGVCAGEAVESNDVFGLV